MYLGCAYNKLNDAKEALRYLEQALPMHEAHDNPSALAVTLKNMAFAYHNTDDTKRALHYYERALSFERAVNDEEGQLLSHLNIAAILHKEGRKDEAMR